jgi:putative restriction endonuclease
MEKLIIANISWNPMRWRETFVNPKAGHEYARTHPGHESLNFKFDKKGIDTETHVYGFVQWKYPPQKLENGGVIIFYTNNTDENKGQIVGIYCNVEVFDNRIKWEYKGFENNQIHLNLRTDKSLSMLFPIALNANDYKAASNQRLTGQVGFSYHDISLATRIIQDELVELKKSGLQEDEFLKLKKIYTYITGENDGFSFLNKDELEQQSLIDIYEETSIEEKINELKKTTGIPHETVTVNQKVYKRDNKTIALLKSIRGFKCQMCGKQIKKKDGGYYIEAAHIRPKYLKGAETPDNILILCPNHHKEFDFGALEIIEHSENKIQFVLNGKEYNVKLKL